MNNTHYHLAVLINTCSALNLLVKQPLTSMHGMEKQHLILTLPMPVGLSPAPYYVDVIATNVDDPSVSVSYRINVEILDTAAVGVSDESSDQSFLPGSMDTTDRSFEITNYGNSEDRFTITLDMSLMAWLPILSILFQLVELQQLQSSHQVKLGRQRFVSDSCLMLTVPEHSV